MKKEKSDGAKEGKREGEGVSVIQEKGGKKKMLRKKGRSSTIFQVPS